MQDKYIPNFHENNEYRKSHRIRGLFYSNHIILIIKVLELIDDFITQFDFFVAKYNLNFS